MGDENSVPYSAAANTTRTQDNTSRSQVGSEELAAPPKTSNKTTTTRKVIPAKTEKKTGVNWGGIVKGVAIVAAVVVVGVGVFYGGSALATWAMSSPAVSGVANSVVGAVEPVLATANNGVEWLKGYLPWVDNIVGGFFRGLFGMEAAGAGVAATAAPAVTTPFTAAVVKNIPGAVGLLGAGGALSVAFHSAFPALGDISLFNHSTVTTPPMEQVDVTNTVTTHPDSANVAAPGHEGNHDLAQAAELGLNSQEISHHAVHGHTAMRHESHTPTSDQAVDAGGDANGDVGANDLSAPDVDVDENAVSKTSWKNRVAPDGRTAGKKGFLANFLASRNPDTAEVTARPSEYTAAIKEDRANASLAEARI